MVRVAADTNRRRMPLRPFRRCRDEIENLFDGLAYLDAVANARHPHVPPATPAIPPPALCLAANMYGEPDCFCICLLNSVSHMARNRHMIALFHPHEFSPFELQGRFPAHYDDPFVLILIVPKTRRAT